VPITHLHSKRQVRAMFAAAAGHSNIGIPQSVGQEMTAGTGHGEYAGAVKRMPESAHAKHVPHGHKVVGPPAWMD
jgi:hypothetical protein